MCQFLASRSPLPFRRVNRSLRIDGHSTSIELEAAFWAVLDGMAAQAGLSTPKLLAALHQETMQIQGTEANFASSLRTICLRWQGAACQSS